MAINIKDASLCRGVSNNDFFKARIAYLEKQYGKKATGYSFREKKYGWTARIEQITFAGGKTLAAKLLQAYTRFFYDGLSLRPSCRSCAYCDRERAADLTMGDCWDIVKITGKKEEKGVSWLQKLDESADVKLYEPGRFRNTPPPKSTPTKQDTVDAFWQVYREKGYDALVNKYYHVSAKGKLKFALKKADWRLLLEWGG